jgi:putative membrane protein insertion efficiency factor
MTIQVRAVAAGIIRIYKMVVSPWLPPACRFTPTCSEYASDAVQQYGVFRGGVRALARLLRCHPFHPGGFDPLT